MTEQQPYTVVRSYPDFELRHYPEHVVAEVTVTGPFEQAGNAAFGALVSYINGANTPRTKVAMTAPVLQEPADEAPSDRHVVSFVMPAGASLATMPAPADPRVRLRTIPPQTAAAARFSGRWTEGSYQQRAEELAGAVERAGFRPVGEPRFARFDPPWTPWFMRRNEVVLPVEAA